MTILHRAREPVRNVSGLDCWGIVAVLLGLGLEEVFNAGEGIGYNPPTESLRLGVSAVFCVDKVLSHLLRPKISSARYLTDPAELAGWPVSPDRCLGVESEVGREPVEALCREKKGLPGPSLGAVVLDVCENG